MSEGIDQFNSLVERGGVGVRLLGARSEAVVGKRGKERGRKGQRRERGEGREVYIGKEREGERSRISRWASPNQQRCRANEKNALPSGFYSALLLFSRVFPIFYSRVESAQQ